MKTENRWNDGLGELSARAKTFPPSCAGLSQWQSPEIDLNEPIAYERLLRVAALAFRLAYEVEKRLCEERGHDWVNEIRMPFELSRTYCHRCDTEEGAPARGNRTVGGG